MSLVAPQTAYSPRTRPVCYGSIRWASQLPPSLIRSRGEFFATSRARGFSRFERLATPIVSAGKWHSESGKVKPYAADRQMGTEWAYGKSRKDAHAGTCRHRHGTMHRPYRPSCSDNGGAGSGKRNQAGANGAYRQGAGMVDERMATVQHWSEKNWVVWTASRRSQRATSQPPCCHPPPGAEYSDPTDTPRSTS